MTLGHALVAHIVIARAASCTDALVFDQSTTNGTFAVGVLIVVHAARVTRSALHNSGGRQGCRRSGGPRGGLNFRLRVHRARIDISGNGERNRGRGRGRGRRRCVG